MLETGYKGINRIINVDIFYFYNVQECSPYAFAGVVLNAYGKEVIEVKVGGKALNLSEIEFQI